MEDQDQDHHHRVFLSIVGYRFWDRFHGALIAAQKSLRVLACCIADDIKGCQPSLASARDRMRVGFVGDNSLIAAKHGLFLVAIRGQ